MSNIGRYFLGLVSLSLIGFTFFPGLNSKPVGASIDREKKYFYSGDEWFNNFVEAPLKQDNETILEFELLRFEDQTLRGPFDITGILFSLPAHWQVTGGSVILDLSIFFGEDFREISGEGLGIGIGQGQIGVTLNGVALDSIPFRETGNYEYTIELEPDSLVSSRDDGRHILQIFIDSGLSCYYDWQPSVTIHDSSRFVFEYDEVSPIVDLKQYPRQIFQQSYLSDRVTIVLPDSPSTGEVQAGLTVASGLGRFTRGRIEFSLTSLDRLQNEELNSGHLIFVGKMSAFPILNDVPLPLKYEEEGFDFEGERSEDGVVQMAVSPWNPAKIILVVSGNTDNGVYKAGQAVYFGQIRPGEELNLALVSEVEEVSYETPLISDTNLVNLGYEAVTVTNKGTNWIEYDFSVPAGFTVTTDASLDLVFNHSALLDFNQSTIEILINDQTIKGIQLSGSSTEIITVPVKIPPDVVRVGNNRLTVKVILEPWDECINPNLNALWLTIWPESEIHLELEQILDFEDLIFDLGEFPSPFSQSSTLNSTAVILPEGDPVAWNAAAQVLFELGNYIRGPIAEFQVSFGNNLPTEILNQSHLLIIGKASTLPIIAELGEVLPAPFEPKSDYAQERNVNVIYRFPQGKDMGYIELASSPWNSERVIMAVLGSTDQGLDWAAETLSTPGLRNQLSGNFAIVDGDQIVLGRFTQNVNAQGPTTEDVQEQEVEGEKEDTTPVGVSQIVPNTQGQPEWLLPAIAVSLGLIVLIVLLVVAKSFSARKKN